MEKDLKNNDLKLNILIKIGKQSNLEELIDKIINLITSCNKNNKKIDVVLQGIKNAICKVVLVSEVIKSRIKGVHQICDISCLNKIENENKSNIEYLIPKIEVILFNYHPEKIPDLGYAPPYSISQLYKLNTVNNDKINKKDQSNIEIKSREVLDKTLEELEEDDDFYFKEINKIINFINI